MKKTLFLILILLVVFSSVSMAENQKEIKVYVDGELVVFPDQQPMIDGNGRTLVPVRFPSEKFGANVEWNQNDKRVDITHDLKKKDIKLWISKSEYIVNEITKEMDTEAVLIGGRTMIPIRFVAEALDVVVDWKQVEGVGIVFNFTKGQSKSEMDKIMNEVVEKEKKEVATPSYNNIKDIKTTSGIKLVVKEKGKDNPYNVDFSIWADIDKDVDAQYREVRLVLETKFGKNEKVNEIISYMRTKTTRDKQLEFKEWTINGQKIGVDSGNSGWSSIVTVWETK